jgi:ectoine hydroxylase-related dioxygenase (phytanoyl-CoA dioxygenase family)
VRLYHDQALFKEPGGRRTPWHQDHYYWPLDTDAALTMWLALVDVPLEMGPMTFASGSHRAGELGPLPISEETDARLARVVEERRFSLVSTPLRAGDATFHSSRTLHSARPNLTASRREVMTVIYFADGTRVCEPDNPHQKVDLDVFLAGAQPGEPAAGPLNPVPFAAGRLEAKRGRRAPRGRPLPGS